MIADPPLDAGVCQFNMTRPSPGTAARLRGADGTDWGVAEASFDLGPSPADETAATS